MKLREEFKEKLLEPVYIGYLMYRTGVPYHTLKRWVQRDYKDLRLPEYSSLLAEVLEVEVKDLFIAKEAV